MGLGQVKFWNPYINCKGSCEGRKKNPDLVFQALVGWRPFREVLHLCLTISTVPLLSPLGQNLRSKASDNVITNKAKDHINVYD